MAHFHRRPMLAIASLTLIGVVSTLGAARYANFWPFTPTALMLYFQEQQYDPLDAVTAGQLAELRAAAGLDDTALAVCNLNDADLERVLAGLRTWWGDHAATWLANQTAIADTQILIRQYESAINNGQDKLHERNDARTTLAARIADRDTLTANLRSTALNGLSQGVSDTLDRLRSQTDVGMPYRVLPLDGTQKNNLAAALVKVRQRLAVAQDDDTRETIQNDFTADLRNALGADNLNALETLRSYQPAASERVLNAVHKVLPTEEQH